MAFNSLKLHDRLLQAVNTAGFDAPTPVQAQSIPHIMAGRDLLACAQTGTGKTAAFTLPLAHKLLTTPRTGKINAPRALVLTPTRELADQVRKSVNVFAQHTDLKSGLVVGGVAYGPQIKMLERPLDILVATPGRLIDHLNEGRVDLSQVTLVVLDEADRMLDMGFSKPVETIMSKISAKRQTLLFSATFDGAVEKMAKRFLQDPAQVRLAATTQPHTSIEQGLYYTTSREHKMELLQELLDGGKIWQTIVFMRTKHSTERLAKTISIWGHEALALHGDMRQSARKRVMEQMHKGKVRVLVATDVAARGLDVKDLSHVINFDLPQMAEDYIHRIGRTGRAGAEGVALSFVSHDEAHLLRDIEKLLGQKIPPLNAPFASDKKAAEKHAKQKKQDRKDSKKMAASYEPRKSFKKPGKGNYKGKPAGTGKSSDTLETGSRFSRSAGKPAGRTAAAENTTAKPFKSRKPFNKSHTGFKGGKSATGGSSSGKPTGTRTTGTKAAGSSTRQGPRNGKPQRGFKQGGRSGARMQRG